MEVKYGIICGMRLKGFDYKKPFFYMVMLKAAKGALPFAGIRRGPEIEGAAHCHGRSNTPTDPDRYLEPNAITHAFCTVIMQLHHFWQCIEPITCFSVMPDHIHLLVKLRAVPNPVSLPRIVWQLKRRLETAYCAAVGAAAGNTHTDVAEGKSLAASRAGGLHPLERDWHDWIVKKDGQLAAFTRYIRENPYRAWLRRQNRQYFGAVGKVEFLGRAWYAYGNTAILDLPVLMPFKGHRATMPDCAEWADMVHEAGRIGPGGAGVSTFMSPLEKACGNAIAKAGGSLVVLSPEGFGERWHPPREKERYCAAGRMLFLSLYPVGSAKPDKRTMYARCHEMVDLALERLG